MLYFYSRKFTAIVLVLSVGLASCATKKVQPTLASQAQAKKLNLNGRLSLVIEYDTGKKQASSMLFTLIGNKQKGNLVIRSPLGNILGIANWTPQQAVLKQGKKTQTYESLESLLQAIVGTPIPANTMFDWLRGKTTTAKGWNVDLTKYNAGKIRASRLQPKPVAHLRLVIVNSTITDNLD